MVQYKYTYIPTYRFRSKVGITRALQVVDVLTRFSFISYLPKTSQVCVVPAHRGGNTVRIYTHTVLSVSIFVYTHIMLLKVLYRVNQTTLLTVYVYIYTHTQTRCAHTVINRPVVGSYNIDYPTAQVKLCRNSRRLYLYLSATAVQTKYYCNRYHTQGDSLTMLTPSICFTN